MQTATEKQGRIFPGQMMADRLSNDLRQLIKNEDESFASNPCLVILMMGNNASSEHFVRKKQILAANLGIQTIVTRLSEQEATMKTVLSLIQGWNKDKSIHGIMVQLPIPEGLDLRAVKSAIDICKDVDGMHPMNFSNTAQSQIDAPDVVLIPAVVRAIALVVRNLLSKEQLRGLRVLIINDSFLVGRPLSNMLLNAGCTVTVAHVYTKNLPQLIGDFDMVITATGRPGLIDIHDLKDDAIVIDAGSNYDEKSVRGDVKYDSSKTIGKRILTPVPGGVGPLTVASLMYNVVMACRMQTGCRLKQRLPNYPDENAKSDRKSPKFLSHNIDHDFRLRPI